MIGVSMLAGSTEDGVGLKIFREGMVWGEPGWPKITFIPLDQKWHEEKIIILPVGRMRPHPWAPNILPLQILRIGSIALVAVPAEITTMSGRRLRETVAQELAGVGVKDVIISSYSNAYTSYVATREEYAKQHYEGASTLYGPYTLNGYQQLFSEMARAMVSGVEVAEGPTPPDLTKALIHRKYGPPFDTVPGRKNFGDLVQDVAPQYKCGDVASAVFWGGHPKNDCRIQGTFLEVQKLSGQAWVTVARDWDPETRYIWKKQGTASKITIEWRIPAETEPGEYRLVHHGNWKSNKTKEITPYTGFSGTFLVD